MNEKDRIGKRGETVFAFLIGKRCNGRFWFDTRFLGEKTETKDFTVYLAKRKLKVRVTESDVEKLKRVTGPAYIAAIDVEGEVGYLLAVTRSTRNKAINGVPCKNPIDCTLITRLWAEVEAYWTARNMTATKSLFS